MRKDSPVEPRPGEAVIWTDGACSGNPGPGGWAAIVIPSEGAEPVELSGGERVTTNNRMELTAALEGLRALPDGSQVGARPARLREGADHPRRAEAQPELEARQSRLADLELDAARAPALADHRAADVHALEREVLPEHPVRDLGLEHPAPPVGVLAR